MKAYKLHEPKSLDTLKVGEYPEPEVRAHEVKVQVKATSLNYRDLIIAKARPALGCPEFIYYLLDLH